MLAETVYILGKKKIDQMESTIANSRQVCGYPSYFPHRHLHLKWFCQKKGQDFLHNHGI